MSGLKRLFCEHPESVNETYFEHLMFATGFGVRMIVAGLACLAHGLLPFLFETTGSRCVRDLNVHLFNCGRSAKETKLTKEQAPQI